MNLLGSLIGFVIVGATMFAISKRIRNKKPNGAKSTNTVLFFPDKEFPCQRVISGITKMTNESNLCLNPSCRKLHGRSGEAPSSMIEFLRHLASARRSIDLCIYLFTQTSLADALYDLHRGNVKIRVIADASEDDTSASKLIRLKQAGIQIKSNPRGTGALMHHKFVIIDGHLLLTGSFNWTSKAVVSNYEAVLITSESSLVKPFQTQFEHMWNKFAYYNSRRESPISRFR